MMSHNKKEIIIPLKNGFIYGNLTIVEQAKGLIIFAHGSGSSRFSTRNNFVAHKLNEAQFSTLLFDLLTKEEEKIDEITRELRFNIPLLAQRLSFVTKWVMDEKITIDVPIGYFGASTGAAAALMASVECPDIISAIVSRGGRPDLAKAYLSLVKAPTLLIVGQQDHEVIILNQEAYEQLTCEKKLVLIPRATHLFEEEGTLLEATNYAIDWFNAYLQK
jgi:putative phosphoribosyl transferase